MKIFGSPVTRRMTSQGANMAKLIATVCVVFVHSINIFNFEGIVEPAFLEGFKAIAEAGVPVFF